MGLAGLLINGGKAMKILQVIPSFLFGGGETMCENLCYALTALGHEVTAVSLSGERTAISRRMESRGIRVLYLDKRPGLDVTMIPKLTRLFRDEQPDVIHTHLNVVKYAAPAARLAGRSACVHTVHNMADKEETGIALKISKFLFRRGWAKPVALSPLVRQSIHQVHGLEEKDVPVIYNGIDLSRLLPKEDYGVGDTVTLLHVGRFEAQKNHKGLVEAFARLHQEEPQCVLHLLGDGELRGEIEQLVREKGLTDCVRFLGLQAEVPPYLHQADIFLLPSIYEGMPMSIIEAMGTGLPIVATAVGGVPDMLRDGEDALLVPCDPEAIFRACQTLVSDMELRARLGTNARENSTRFSAEYMARQYCRVYTNVAE